jgi:hypothetical protein
MQTGKEAFVLKINNMNKVKTKTAKTKSIIEMPVVNPYSGGY